MGVWVGVGMGVGCKQEQGSRGGEWRWKRRTGANNGRGADNEVRPSGLRAPWLLRPGYRPSGSMQKSDRRLSAITSVTVSKGSVSSWGESPPASRRRSAPDARSRR